MDPCTRHSFFEGWAPLENTVFYYAHSNLWLNAKSQCDFTIDGYPGLRSDAGWSCAQCAAADSVLVRSRLQETPLLNCIEIQAKWNKGLVLNEGQIRLNFAIAFCSDLNSRMNGYMPRSRSSMA